MKTSIPVSLNVPFVAQERYQCGPAAVSMILNYQDIDIPIEQLVVEVYSPDKKGSIQPSLVAAGRRHGLLSHELLSVKELMAELTAGRPVVILQNLALKWRPVWHYAVVVGFDPNEQDFILHTGIREGRRVSAKTLLSTWQRAGSWGLIYLKPSELPAISTVQQTTRELIAYERSQPVLAKVSYLAALERWPTDVFLLTTYANYLNRGGDTSAAEGIYRQALVSDPSYVPALNNLADLLMRSGQLDEAEMIASTAAKIDGSYKDIAVQTLKEIELLKK